MRPDLITFDCYGTLIDWRNGITSAFRSELEEAVDVDDERLLDAYHDVEAELEAAEYRPYREVLGETAERVAARLEWPLARERRGFLAESLPTWKPFADTNPGLERLEALGYRLGILSNIDDDLLSATLTHFTVPFDLLVTAQQVEAYKPAPLHFQRAIQEVGGDPVRLLHVAQSHYHDVEGARPLGIRVLWVNRTGERPAGEAEPYAEVPDLRAAVEWIESEDTPAR